MSLLVKACEADWLSESLWMNSSIQIGNESILFKYWYEKGNRFINDLMDSNGNLLSHKKET